MKSDKEAIFVIKFVRLKPTCCLCEQTSKMILSDIEIALLKLQQANKAEPWEFILPGGIVQTEYKG